MSRYLYVTSTVANARYAQLGHPITLRRKVFTGPHATTTNMHADRALCRACVREATGLGWITADEADRMLGRTPRPRQARRGADQLVGLPAEGRTDREIAVRLRVSMRTVNRLVTDAMRDLGARTRFQWGHLVGVAAR